MIRIYIVIKMRSYGEALGQAIHRPGRVEVVGSCAHRADALLELPALNVDVVLLDAHGPEGPWWVGEITRVLPSVRVVVMGLAEAEQEVVAWAHAGVAGYLGREASLKELAATIEVVMRGPAAGPRRTRMIPVRPILMGPEGGIPTSHTDRHLTDREQEILHLVGQGLSNQQIAKRLYIAVPTVKNHVHNILEKLGVHRRIEALTEIRRAGFVLGRGLVPISEGLPQLQAIPG
jgi:DNA-binding NarL/FixJ family response regulator